MLGVAAGAATIATIALIGGASAHSPFDSSTPAPGAVLSSAPTSVSINFKENIQKTFGSYGVTLTRDGGGDVPIAAPTASSDTQLTATLPASLPAGRYVVNWNNTSADDGDPLSGAFSFYVNTQPTAANLAADQQLSMIEGSQLATATAEANAQATQTASAGAPAPVATAPAASTPAASTPVARPSAAAPSAALPGTGTGTGQPGGADVWLIAALVLGSTGVAATSIAYYRRRAR
jgi:methionine-rich copper-binding protein CopC